MLATVYTCAVVGLEGALIQVEVYSGNGSPGITIVGLPDTAIQESRERVRAALRNSGLKVPYGKVVVNLAPADIRKEGPAYDLPIALGMLLASEQVIADMTETMAIGELSLDGTLRHTHGILPMVSLARERGFKRVLVPEANAAEAALIDGLEVIPASDLMALVRHLWGEELIEPYPTGLPAPEQAEFDNATDLQHIRGQEHVKRGLEVAAAGAHNLLMAGPPGSGKTLLARSIPTILPPLDASEALEVSKIYSVTGLLPTDQPLLRQRPYRSPHHTISYAGLVGGGQWPRPGEITLSHRGVLFLDEFPEFSHRVLEVLRQPLEDRIVTISRASGAITYPANFILAAAMNPCPCGFAGDPIKDCTCSPSTITRYQKRISGPLLDRIDIHLEVPRIEYEKLADRRPGETSARVRDRVSEARERQAHRYGCGGTRLNSDMGPAEIQAHCRLDEAGDRLLKAAVQQLQLSARAYHRVLKLARTIADLSGADHIETSHLAEALQYRQRNMT